MRGDLTGLTLGEWTVLARHPEKMHGHSQWICRCSCGETRTVIRPNLTTGKSKSCGHTIRTLGGLWSKFTKEYDVWRQMHRRCNDPNNRAYNRYGGRGIRVCERWKDFSNFLEDMGRQGFQGAQLDRIDNDGNYEKSNCRWATARENSHNSTAVRLIEYNGTSLPIAEWERRLGFPGNVLSSRLHNGWSIERAMTQKYNRMRTNEQFVRWLIARERREGH